MNLTELSAVLSVLREAGVVSAEVPTSGGPLRIVFEPSAMPLPPGDETTPGGWKSPALDQVEYEDPDRRLP